VTAASDLTSSYRAFTQPVKNIIGGNATGSQINDGDNGQIVLDALPSKYDFPALTSSLQALLNRQSINIDSIGGSDDQLQQQTAAPDPPAPVPMPFSFKVDGSYEAIQKVVSDFQSSIRPFQAQTFKISGDQSDLTIETTYQTYYQPEKKFTITNEIIQ
ncbi:MAG: hypothetical protein ACREGF_03530, partial [Candidatus Saccharimonadales bacterium]